MNKKEAFPSIHLSSKDLRLFCFKKCTRNPIQVFHGRQKQIPQLRKEDSGVLTIQKTSYSKRGCRPSFVSFSGMTDAGFFKGTSAEQDARFADKKKKLMKTMKFGDNLSQKVDMTRINLDCIRPWVAKRITELLNFEDEVVCNYVLNQLEERVSWHHVNFVARSVLCGVDLLVRLA
ncbi:hypothetical protein EG68_03137 [Paragonimus skrjabini miyazakii]|uniref:PWI domain-containing protein n=1 Tax=Paragonimus skrjabini miyazakii TaxID=59628 RepID=A0A8S9YY13_9TREM|nr:hypothetical protein EG68_03137 [Paragonimus skrjabini miyazakii]